MTKKNKYHSSQKLNKYLSKNNKLNNQNKKYRNISIKNSYKKKNKKKTLRGGAANINPEQLIATIETLLSELKQHLKKKSKTEEHLLSPLPPLPEVPEVPPQQIYILSDEHINAIELSESGQKYRDMDVWKQYNNSKGVFVFDFDNTLIKQHLTTDLFDLFKEFKTEEINILINNPDATAENIVIIKKFIRLMMDRLTELRHINVSNNKDKEKEIFFGEKCKNIKEFITECKQKGIMFTIASFGFKIIIEILLCYLLYIDGGGNVYNASNAEAIIDYLCDSIINKKCSTEGIFITTTEDYKFTQNLPGKSEWEGRYIYEDSTSTDFNKRRQLDLICNLFVNNDKTKVLFFDDDKKGKYNNETMGNVIVANNYGYLNNKIKTDKYKGFQWEDLKTTLIDPHEDIDLPFKDKILEIEYKEKGSEKGLKFITF